MNVNFRCWGPNIPETGSRLRSDRVGEGPRPRRAGSPSAARASQRCSARWMLALSGSRTPLREDCWQAAKRGPNVHHGLPRRLRRTSIETDPSFVQEALSIRAPAGLQSTNGGQTRSTSSASERRQLKAWNMDRLVGVPGQEFFIMSTKRSAPERPASTACGCGVPSVPGLPYHSAEDRRRRRVGARKLKRQKRNKSAQRAYGPKPGTSFPCYREKSSCSNE